VTLVWCIYALAAAGIGVVSGIITGFLFKRGQWRTERLHWTGWLGSCALWLFYDLIRVRMHLPYPPQLLAEQGKPMWSGMIGVGTIVLSAWLATAVARRMVRRVDLRR